MCGANSRYLINLRLGSESVDWKCWWHFLWKILANVTNFQVSVSNIQVSVLVSDFWQVSVMEVTATYKYHWQSLPLLVFCPILPWHLLSFPRRTWSRLFELRPVRSDNIQKRERIQQFEPEIPSTKWSNTEKYVNTDDLNRPRYG